MVIGKFTKIIFAGLLLAVSVSGTTFAAPFRAPRSPNTHASLNINLKTKLKKDLALAQKIRGKNVVLLQTSTNVPVAIIPMSRWQKVRNFCTKAWPHVRTGLKVLGVGGLIVMIITVPVLGAFMQHQIHVLREENRGLQDENENLHALIQQGCPACPAQRGCPPQTVVCPPQIQCTECPVCHECKECSTCPPLENSTITITPGDLFSEGFCPAETLSCRQQAATAFMKGISGDASFGESMQKTGVDIMKGISGHQCE